MSETPEIQHPPRREWFAFAWGLAEATFFFLVPDVLLTRIALRDFPRAAVACLWATAGALVGGALLWVASHSGATVTLLHACERLPGINRHIVREAGRALQQHGLLALFTGALRGLPYKLFALHAAAQKFPLPAFLAISALARFSRFALTTCLAAIASRGLRSTSEAFRRRLHAWLWIAFYALYFVAVR